MGQIFLLGPPNGINTCSSWRHQTPLLALTARFKTTCISSLWWPSEMPLFKVRSIPFRHTTGKSQRVEGALLCSQKT